MHYERQHKMGLMVSFMFEPFRSRGKSFQYPLERVLDGLQRRSKNGEAQKNPACDRNQTQVIQPIANQLTLLFQLMSDKLSSRYL
jgi:hypothetical protein